MQATDKNIYHTLLHELSHIYCIRNEYRTEHGPANFHAENCRDEENEFLLTGYSVWKEFIAEYLACGIEGFVPSQEAFSEWPALEAEMEKRRLPYVDVVRLVYHHIEEKGYKIDPIFISELGSMIVVQMAMEEWKRTQKS